MASGKIDHVIDCLKNTIFRTFSTFHQQGAALPHKAETAYLAAD